MSKKKEQYVLEKLYIDTKGRGYPPVVYYDCKKRRLIRVYRGAKSRYWKKHCHKKLRRFLKGYEAYSKNSFVKYTEFWWNMD